MKEGFNLINENDDKFDIYQSLFKRYIYCFESINLFLQDFDKSKAHRAQSIGIILRASLLDYLTTLYILTFQVEKKNGTEKEKIAYQNVINKLLSEQIRRFLTVSESDKKLPSYNREKFKKTVDSYRKIFHYLFDHSKPIDYNKPSKSLIYNPSDDIKSKAILKRLDSFPKESIKLNYKEVYGLYDIYSKYDHFGIASMTLEHLTINEICENMFWSIFHLTDGLSFCVDLMKDETGSKSNFERMFKEIDYLRGTVYTKTLYLSESYKNEHA